MSTARDRILQASLPNLAFHRSRRFISGRVLSSVSEVSISSADGRRVRRRGRVCADTFLLRDAVDATSWGGLGFYTDRETLTDGARECAAHRVLLPARRLDKLIDCDALLAAQ